MALDFNFPIELYNVDEPNIIPNNDPLPFDQYRDTIYNNPILTNISVLQNSLHGDQDDLIIDNNNCEYYDCDKFANCNRTLVLFD